MGTWGLERGLLYKYESIFLFFKCSLNTESTKENCKIKSCVENKPKCTTKRRNRMERWAHWIQATSTEVRGEKEKRRNQAGYHNAVTRCASQVAVGALRCLYIISMDVRIWAYNMTIFQCRFLFFKFWEGTGILLIGLSSSCHLKETDDATVSWPTLSPFPSPFSKTNSFLIPNGTKQTRILSLSLLLITIFPNWL